MNDLFGSLINAGHNGGNLMQIIGSMAGRNPGMNQVLQIINGKNPQQLEQTARNMAKEAGIDIDAMIRNLGLK